jgi:hypothetical protein
MMLIKTGFDCGLVADIKGVDVGKHPSVLRISRSDFLELCSQLAFTACD